MKKLFNYIGVALIFICFSCENVIDLELEHQREVVIDAILEEGAFPTVEVSYTTDYFEPNLQEKINHAEMTISDDLGNSYPLVLLDEGLYTAEQLLGESRRRYQINVVVDEEVYTATSTIHQAVSIDSVTFEKLEGLPDFGPGEDRPAEPYLMTLFLDLEEGEYVRAVIYQNGEIVDGYFLSDNNKFEIQHFFELGDDVEVQLHTIDQASYFYYTDLSNLSGDTNFGVPSNPVNNWSGSALGNFVAFSSETMILKVQ